MRGLVLLGALLWGLVCYEVVSEVGRPFAGFRYESNLNVSPQTVPSWNGPRQGLAPYDRLVSANGVALRTTLDLQRLIARSAPGTPVVYEVDRNGRRLAITVKIQQLQWRDVVIGFAPTLLIGLLHIVIGSMAFFLNPTSPAVRAHLLLALTLGVGLQTLGIDFSFSQWFPRLYLLLVCFLGATGAHLALTFPRPLPLIARKPRLLVLAYLPAALLAIAYQLDYRPFGIAASAPPHYFGNTLVVWGILSALGFLVLLTRLLLVATNGRSRTARQQGLIVLIGAVAGYLPSVVAYVIPIVMNQGDRLSMRQINLAYALCTIFPVTVAYAMLRHRLFGIRMVIKRTMTYAFVSMVLTVLYFALVHVTDRILEPHSRAGGVLAILVLTMVFAPLHQWTQRVLERLFFRASYDPQRITAEFGDALKSLHDPQEIVSLFADRLQAALQPRALAVVLEGSFGDLKVLRADKPAAAERLEEGISIPLRSGASRIGTLQLGPRRTGYAYDEHDGLFLNNLAQQMTGALRSAELFRALQARNAELEEANHHLKELDRLKSNFLNAASHELRTPLASIVGYAEFLEDGLGGELSETQATYVGQIQAGAGRLQRLVEDLLDFARVEAGTLAIQLEPIDLVEKVRGVIDGLRPQARAVQVSLAEELPSEPLVLDLDAQRIEQVLFNLMANAIKFTPEGGEVTISLRETPEGARVEVRDTGIGIAREHVPHLFQKFFQVNTGTTRQYGGTGLGLSIAKAFVEAHAGRIGVESTPDEGSVFWFSLPRAPENASGLADPEAPLGQLA
ncbi:MAG TPA: ATP-binding protein [Pantanalinema sp.]